jgi:hypothetical protein
VGKRREQFWLVEPVTDGGQRLQLRQWRNRHTLVSDSNTYIETATDLASVSADTDAHTTKLANVSTHPDTDVDSLASVSADSNITCE